MSCQKTFSSKKRLHTKKFIERYLFDKQIYRALIKQGVSYKTVQKAIERLDYRYPKLIPRACVVAIDTTYFSRNFGVTIFRDVTNNVTLHWVFVERENMKTHIEGIRYLKEKGIIILGFIVDGFWGFYVHYYKRYDIQMCQKHMADIVRRYTTRKPKLRASKELKAIVDKLSNLSKHGFSLRYDSWLQRWAEFLKEKSYQEGSDKWVYTHQRLRSAVTSLNRYRSFLFTFERNRWLPNTNNSIEGFNSGLKAAIGLHRGLRRDRRIKLIHCYLREKSKFNWGKRPTHLCY